MAKLQAKIGWKRMCKREIKNYPSIPFQSDAEQKTPKQKDKKFKKLKNTIMASF